MARGAHLRILAREPGGVETRAVRVYVPAADRRVAGEAVALGVAADAGLEALARRPTMPRDEELVRVVIAVAQRPLRRETGPRVTASAELPGVVAVAAGGLARVRRRRVTRQEAGWVIPGRAGGVGPVALEAVVAYVATGARGWDSIRGGGVTCPEALAVRRRSPARDDGTNPPPRTRGEQPHRHPRGPRVAGEAALLRVTGAALLWRAARNGAVLSQERPGRVRRRSLETRLDPERAGVGGERLDGRLLRGIHVTL